MVESSKKLKTLNVVLSCIVCLNQNRSALVRDLSYYSPFICQDKSLVLRARDLILFTTDLQTVNYNSTNHCQS